MKPNEVVKFLNTDATDEQFAEVFALLEIAMNGRGVPQDYNAEKIIAFMNVDIVCNKLKVILKEIQEKFASKFLDEFLIENEEIVKCKHCGNEMEEWKAEYCDFETGSDYICSDCLGEYGYCEVCKIYYSKESDVEIYGLRGGCVCSDCYDEHGWRYE